ncbi:MAG: hypothetical protein AAFV33_08350, partial [Chloroflexota bacterium]
MISSTLSRGQRLALLTALLTLVTSVYMLTYSGRMGFTDTRFMFDATESLVRDGDFLLDLTNGERRFWDYEEPLPNTPLVPVNAEPLQMVLAAPLYLLADALPRVGYVHAVWLFNVLVSALAVGVFYLYALQLGYNERTAIVTGLLFAFGTNLWAYSKTFFQEPLTLLLILLTAYFVERWRASGYRSVRAVIAVVVAFALAFAARRAAPVMLPVLLVIGFPYLERFFAPLWVRRGFFALVGVTAVGLFIASRLPSVPFHEALHGYFFSIGGSLWGTSPVVLLAVPGIWLLAKQVRMRYVIAALLMTLIYAGAYAYGAGNEWFGGLSFPPRFLVPILPFLMLCALPAIDYLLSAEGRRSWRIATGVLIVYSVWIQFNTVTYWWGEYTTLLPLEAGGLTEWRGGLDDVRYLRWVVLPQLWGVQPFDFAWIRTGQLLFPLIFGGLAVLSAAGMWLVSQRTRAARYVSMILPLLLIVSLYGGMRLIYSDDLYLAFSDGLARSLDVIERELDTEDVLILSQPGYEVFYMNYGAITGPRVITLPFHQGERENPDAVPVINSPNPARLLERPTIQLINSLAEGRESLWLLSHSSPFITWSVRPVERYMAQYHYPLRTIDLTGDDGLPVRLIEYSTVTAPTQ